MRVFEFQSYKELVLGLVAAMPQRGRGQLGKIARHLRVHSTMVSQIFRGAKDLTLDQACALADYFGMSELETDYFIALVERERAGTLKLRRAIDRRIAQLKAQSAQVASRLPRAKTLSEEDKAVFYSHWYYSGARLLTSLEAYRTPDAVAAALSLPPSVVRRVIDFLIATGLCEEVEGELRMGPSRTHVPADSPLVQRHHVNWRLRAMERLPRLSDEELAFTMPMTISRQDGPRIREILTETIQRVSETVDRTDPEKLACLNIDWVDILT
jgi:uncharacterized protein (TIGR02147 family)